MSYVLRKAGTGSRQQIVEAGGKHYRVRWAMTAPDAPSTISTQASDAETVAARVNVDYLDLLPFGGVKRGSSARFTITTTTGGKEQFQFNKYAF